MTLHASCPHVENAIVLQKISASCQKNENERLRAETIKFLFSSRTAIRKNEKEISQKTHSLHAVVAMSRMRQKRNATEYRESRERAKP
jgi:hypothetical protein